jgi:hypothetical protein
VACDATNLNLHPTGHCHDMEVQIVGEEGATEADWARMLAEDGEDSHAAPCSAEIAERQRERLELRARLRWLLRLVQLVGGGRAGWCGR